MEAINQLNSVLLPQNRNVANICQIKFRYIFILFLFFIISSPIYLYFLINKKNSLSSFKIKNQTKDFIILKNDDKNKNKNDIKMSNLTDNIIPKNINRNKTKNSYFKSFLSPIFFIESKESSYSSENQNQYILMNLINNQYSGIWESYNSGQKNSKYAIGKSNKGNTIIKFEKALESKSRLDSIALVMQNNEEEYVDHWIKFTSFANFQNLNKNINVTQKTFQLSGNFKTTMEIGEFLESKSEENIYCDSIINITFPLIFNEKEKNLIEDFTKIASNISSINTESFTLIIDSSCGYKLKIKGEISNEFLEKMKKGKKLKIYFMLSLSSSIFYIIGVITLVFGIKKNEMALPAINIECLVQNSSWNFYLCLSNVYFATKAYDDFFWTFITIGIISIIKFSIFDIHLFKVFWEIKERNERNNSQLMNLKIRFCVYFYFLILSSFFVIAIFFTNPICIIGICSIQWIPQIIHNIKYNNKYGLPLVYILACSIERIIYPLYFRGFKNSFFMLRQNYYTTYTIIFFVIFSVLTLLIQIFKGPRFMLSKKYQENTYNLYKTKNELEKENINRDINNEECVICLLPIFIYEKEQNIEMGNIDIGDEEIEKKDDYCNVPIKNKNEQKCKNTEFISNIYKDKTDINIKINTNSNENEEEEEKIDEFNDNNNLIVKENEDENNIKENINDNSKNKKNKNFILKKYIMNNFFIINNFIFSFFLILRELFKHNLFYFYKASLKKNNKLYILTPCKHIFHSKCLEKWTEHKKVCPNCRTSLENLF